MYAVHCNQGRCQSTCWGRDCLCNCDACTLPADCDRCDNTGQGDPCGKCDGRFHSCHFCDRKPKGHVNVLASDENFQEFLKAHPLSPAESERVQASVERVKRRLRDSQQERGVDGR